MSLRAVGSSAGPPWERPLAGTIEKVTVESELLADNPLGDPAVRPLYVYTPPGVDASGTDRHPSIYVIQGLTGQVDMWLNRWSFEPTMIERVDERFSDANAPPAIVVFVDAWTSLGGSQFINSAGTGRYMDYMCDEIVPFVDERYPTISEPGYRGLAGKSSGGYGAMVVPMLRPDVFGALATHAGDALFEMCYLPDFRQAVRVLRDKFDGSYEVFWERFRTAATFDHDLHGAPLNCWTMAACYSPDEANPTVPRLPFEVTTGRLVDDVWEEWLSWDPVRMAPLHGDALAGMKRIYIDAGRSDDYYLDLGAQAFAAELDKLGIDHTLELFEGTHGGIQHRYPGALKELAMALAPQR